MKNLIESKNISSFFHIESCGTAGYHIGENADQRTLDVLSSNGISFRHSAQQLSKDHFTQFDYLVVMDDNNYRDTLSKTTLKTDSQVFKIRKFDDNQSDEDVIDPYYGGMSGFELCFEQLMESCENLIHFIVKKHNIPVSE